ncbi:hypothetical protein GOP47_0027047 [Adiantum capillus-veneris]|nr:hypothetical protein GOP47_0027047 [Adiantum capillus-veneris]
MAAVLGDRGRKLRARVVAATSAAPLTRSAAAASLNVSNNSIASQHVEGLHRNTSTTSKGALKRAAALDNSSRSLSTANGQQAKKKRPALANLTNCSSIPSTRNLVPPPHKPLIKLKDRQPREGNVAKENLGPLHSTKTEARIPVVVQNNEVTLLQRDTGVVEVPKSAVPSYACAATQTSASLEVRTGHCTSWDPQARTRQGDCCDDYLEGEGWSCKNYTDIDENIKDPQMCGSYVAEIYYYLQMAELKRRPIKNFMEVVQVDINSSMRGILVDWLVEVAEEYKLVPDTLYLTVAYIDRFLSGNIVNRQRLQLLGISCMLIASKYEEICAPFVDEFCYITDNTYCRDEVLEMEKRVLNYLQFELTGPTTKTFLRRFIRAAQAGQKTAALQLEYLGNYLAELTLLEYKFLQYLPSLIAGSAVFLAKVTLNPLVRPWTSTLQHYSGYKASELVECVQAIHDLQCNKKKCTLPAVREKYKQPKFKSVTNLVPLGTIPVKYFEDVDDNDP